LKSKSSSFGQRVQDGAFEAMRRSIRENDTPGLFLLRYKRPEFVVQSVMLIPHFAFNESMLKKRNPLSKAAQRADWVGCIFMLDLIPPDARIDVVKDGWPMPASMVRDAYKRLRPLEKLDPGKRGWTLDVLNVVRILGKPEFVLADVYAHEDELGKLHPANRHIRPKIRQQLQVLRDLGFLEFLGAGEYRLS
jgi:type II restriction enzyme